MGGKYTRHQSVSRMGGKARAKALTAEQRRESATKAVQARWARHRAKAAGVAYVAGFILGTPEKKNPAPILPPIVSVRLAVWKGPKKGKKTAELDPIPNQEKAPSEAPTDLTPTAPSGPAILPPKPKTLRELAENPPNLNI